MSNQQKPKSFTGPVDRLGPGMHPLAPGVWITSGRSAIIETATGLTLIDPGDEKIFEGGKPFGPLAELLAVMKRTGKEVETVFITHAHPDHVANLPALLSFLGETLKSGAPKVAAHNNSPVKPDLPISEETRISGEGITIIPLSGHSPWGDDLALYHAPSRILFSGDLIQPKGETWEETFYPSPYPYFTDAAPYLESLEKLLKLDFQTLVTGHREVRPPPHGREWVELTRRAILAVGEGVAAWPADADPARAAPELYRALALERGIDEPAIKARMTPPGASSFDRYDLPGILHFWEKRRGKGKHP